MESETLLILKLWKLRVGHVSSTALREFNQLQTQHKAQDLWSTQIEFANKQYRIRSGT